MSQVLFVSCLPYPHLSKSDRILEQTLKTAGISTSVQAWNSADQLPFETAELILLRSNWDYHNHIDEFRQWLGQLAESHATIHNSIELINWNLSKEYLLALQAQAINVPKTRLLTSDVSLNDCFQYFNTDTLIVKPLYGASGHLVEKIQKSGVAEWQNTIRKQRGNDAWLVQEYLKEIHAGEISMIFVDGVFSHSVIKTPKEGEFRINSQYQGTIRSYNPADFIIKAAQNALTYLPQMPLYARVDGVIKEQDFCICEIELNEPSLYYTFAPDCAILLAQAIQERLRPRGGTTPSGVRPLDLHK